MEDGYGMSLPEDFGKVTGVKGTYGPNDNAYIDNCVRRAAKQLVDASVIYSDGHYAHSNARELPEQHPLRLALNVLADHDKDICEFANAEHDPVLFAPYAPSEEDKHRWDKKEYQGPAGNTNEK